MTSSSGLPSRLEVDRIIALDAQPALRNLRITQCYHDLSQSFATLFGAVNVNWCTFASWASKTAGRFVRGELMAIFRDALQSDPRLAAKLDRINKVLRLIESSAELDQLVLFEVLNAPVLEVSRYITAGNLAVFGRLGRCFSFLGTGFAQNTLSDVNSLARFFTDLDPKTDFPKEA